MGSIPDLFLWILFFALNVYGQVAMKIATSHEKLEGIRYFWDLATNIWGITAILAWSSSSFLWMILLKKQQLMQAQSISALNYALICIAAVIFLGEAFSYPRLIGILLISAGIYLVATK